MLAAFFYKINKIKHGKIWKLMNLRILLSRIQLPILLLRQVLFLCG